ncbi:RluA family pseudouridine synthase [Kiritimatiella glycovorans]|uniref:Ribosomal large subunit pseudouridine synthase D n=1 Tax=Kiritimatiella glycovorans TaxID=1307763 RepID=A0A0G3EFR4_9BACT|nr:RluA family pseudouridine synthase [Kiritimatiella glycovorans]AKJ64247.1 Ribosomal large subunit pseudouridine synthase D [Kiritimatiella glycovorans]
MKTRTLHVKPGERRLALVDYLARQLGLSKKKAKALLDRRNVFVNRRRTWMAKHELNPGDVVDVSLEKPVHEPAPSAGGVRVLFEDEDYLVADKSAGLLTESDPSSLEALLRRRSGAQSLRAVHRLDRDTTGCVLFAKHPEARRAAIDLFRDRRVTKIYRAIAAGRWPRKEDRIRSTVDGQEALTDLRRLDANRSASYLEIRILTGRTHQIRRHLSREGHPVAGDKSCPAHVFPDDRLALLPRQMLHAYRLSFPHPRLGNEVRTSAPIPEDFEAALREFGLK